MALQKVRITHNGTNGTKTVGNLYLADIGRRNSLGGGASIYEYGQDCYLNPANSGTGAGFDKVELVLTSQVMLSLDRGILYKYSSGAFAGVLTITYL